MICVLHGLSSGPSIEHIRSSTSRSPNFSVLPSTLSAGAAPPPPPLNPNLIVLSSAPPYGSTAPEKKRHGVATPAAWQGEVQITHTKSTSNVTVHRRKTQWFEAAMLTPFENFRVSFRVNIVKIIRPDQFALF
eukprot:1384716-Rhodomonas_salina.3